MTYKNPPLKVQSPQNPDTDFDKRVAGKAQKLARFRWFRQTYSFLKKWQQIFIKSPPMVAQDLESEFFTDVDTDRCLQDLNRQAVAFGFQLPAAAIGEILVFARKKLCFEPDFNNFPFYLREVEDGRLPRDNNRQTYCALVQDLKNCKTIAKLVKDPVLLEIAHRYLQYWPETITTHLTWSIASDRSLKESQKHYPPCNFHYDIAGYNFMTMNFYITPVRSVFDGPHMMIEGTHKKKPWSFFLAGRQSDAQINHHFPDKVRIILGPAGFGFMEDPSCIHRVLPPSSDHRLIFQIRYS